VKSRTIVFLSRSIFVEGVVSRLRQHPQNDAVYFIDPDCSDYIDQVAGILPSVVVIDADQGNQTQWCVLCDLLHAFPEIIILRLKAQEKDVQVITSSSYVVDNVQDLIDLLGRKSHSSKGGELIKP
jgi:hypothetical protein